MRDTAEDIAQWRDAGAIAKLDAVLCNAGGRFEGPVTYSAERYETTFATIFLGNVLFVERLLPALSDDARVIVTASGTHDPGSVDGRLVGKAVEPDAIALARVGKDDAPALSVGRRYAT